MRVHADVYKRKRVASQKVETGGYHTALRAREAGSGPCTVQRSEDK